ncbi:hypothetical protein CEUSTIGMA_g8734.t1 [Chlamydomonas eustigma]|uniref:Integrator complex subunit 4 n=1 Tax=Chlamydomonas eustigma TaxID=1157962 RepID=A0A250XDZ9_9CHLO|nr:hypothetical protein CEUSTIGMA_g8734.t1 [Chlamydomonas eustigma]|eukprot:GAX81303.1 hypothetical protein CEUSTIGMA_g8734.t1 [Chlamydomonas eustigma]
MESCYHGDKRLSDLVSDVIKKNVKASSICIWHVRELAWRLSTMNALDWLGYCDEKQGRVLYIAVVEQLNNLTSNTGEDRLKSYRAWLMLLLQILRLRPQDVCNLSCLDIASKAMLSLDWSVAEAGVQLLAMTLNAAICSDPLRHSVTADSSKRVRAEQSNGGNVRSQDSLNLICIANGIKTMCLFAAQHCSPTVRLSALHALHQVLLCQEENSMHGLHPTTLVQAYQIAVFSGLQDRSKQVRVGACRLAIYCAVRLGSSTRMMMQAPGHPSSAGPAASKRSNKWRKGKKVPVVPEEAGASTVTQEPIREEVPLLQLGRPLSVCDHAFQRLCGLMLDTCPLLKAEALKGLAVLPESCARVRLQAFSKKTTLVVDEEIGAIPNGVGDASPGMKERGQEVESALLDEAVGALVNASEDEDEAVRCALASALASLSKGLTPNQERAVDEQALDFLVDMMHDEANRVRRAAGASLLQLIQRRASNPEQSSYAMHSNKAVKGSTSAVTFLDVEHLEAIVSCLNDPVNSVRSVARQVLLESIKCFPGLGGMVKIHMVLKALTDSWISYAVDRPLISQFAYELGTITSPASIREAATWLHNYFPEDFVEACRRSDAHEGNIPTDATMSASIMSPLAVDTASSKSSVDKWGQHSICFHLIAGALKSYPGTDLSYLSSTYLQAVKQLQDRHHSQEATIGASLRTSSPHNHMLLLGSMRIYYEGHPGPVKGLHGFPVMLKPLISIMKDGNDTCPPRDIWLQVSPALPLGTPTEPIVYFHVPTESWVKSEEHDNGHGRYNHSLNTDDVCVTAVSASSRGTWIAEADVEIDPLMFPCNRDGVVETLDGRGKAVKEIHLECCLTQKDPNPEHPIVPGRDLSKLSPYRMLSPNYAVFITLT